MNDHVEPADPLETERYLGSRVLLAAGAVALVLGATFFFKLAFDNGWIGPTGRVALGLIAGSGLMLWSDRLRATINVLYSESVTALGAFLLYLSFWAAGNGFHVFSVPLSFAGMALVTATLIILALQRNSQLTAALGLAGGFITPELTQTGTVQWINLYAYLGMLSGGLVFVRRNDWHVVRPAAFVLTQLYLLGGLLSFQARAADAPSILTLTGFATLYLAIFSWEPIRKTLAHAQFSATDIILTLLSAGMYYLSLHVTLFDAHRLILTSSIVVLSLGYVMLAYLERSTRTLFATLALALSTGGVAVAFNGHAMTAVWALEGALLAWAGSAMRLPVARIFSLIAFACGIIHLVVAFPDASASLFNERFVTLVIFGLSLLAARIAGARYGDRLVSNEERQIALALEVPAHILLVYALSDQCWVWSNGNQLSLTLVWAAYGALLLIAGFAMQSAYRRVQALVLLMLAVLKAFAIDLNTVDPGVRIVSFLALGFVLLAGSYWYFRMRLASEALK